MKLIFFVFICAFAKSQALECGLKRLMDTELKINLSQCVKNKRIDDIWDFPTFTTEPTEKTTTENNFQNTMHTTETTQTESGDSTLRPKPKMNIRRSKRSITQTEQPVATTTMMHDDATKSDVTTTQDSTETTPDDSCAIHCMFEKIEAVNQNGYPDHQKVSEYLIAKLKPNREMRNFLQDAIDTCFQKLPGENIKDLCETSNEKIACLADFASMNCADWPVAIN